MSNNTPLKFITHDDLKVIGFETKNISSNTLAKLSEKMARKMAEAYPENIFWIDLEIIAKELRIKKF